MISVRSLSSTSRLSRRTQTKKYRWIIRPQGYSRTPKCVDSTTTSPTISFVFGRLRQYVSTGVPLWTPNNPSSRSGRSHSRTWRLVWLSVYPNETSSVYSWRVVLWCFVHSVTSLSWVSCISHKMSCCWSCRTSILLRTTMLWLCSMDY